MLLEGGLLSFMRCYLQVPGSSPTKGVAQKQSPGCCEGSGKGACGEHGYMHLFFGLEESGSVDLVDH